MDNYDFALDAYLKARARLKEFGSDNIRQKATLKKHVKYEDASEVPKMTPEEADYEMRVKPMRRAKIEKMKKMQPKRGEASLDEIIQHGRVAMIEEAGNCFEYAAVVCALLSDYDRPPAHYDVVFMPELDHAFTIIGQPYPDSGEYPMDFRTWLEDAAICDGWAEIVCWARQYPIDWDLMMRMWNLQDKEVPTEPNQWGSPLEYLGAPQREHKMSYRKKSKCFITTAACASLGLPDDCMELSTLRWFRDNILLTTAEGRRDVAEYYDVAPRIVDAVERQTDSRQIYAQIRGRWLMPSVIAVVAAGTKTDGAR